MVAANPPGPSAYSFTLVAGDSSAIVSDESGVDALGPVLTSTGSIVQNIINAGVAGQNLQGVPILNALLIEIRIQNNLLISTLGATTLDLEQMRADEAYNISLISGAQTL
jgi:hypothetical protein